jgi:DUF2934 family protein
MAIKKGPKPADKASKEEELGAQIREAAYHRWREQGRPEGTALDDWLYAEAGITGGVTMKKAPAKKPSAKKKTPI